MARPKLTDFRVEALQDPVEFCTRVLRHPNGQPCLPHEGQAELMRGIAPNTVACTGRQWGKSESMAWYACWFGVMHENRKIYVIAPTLDQASIIFDKIIAQFSQTPLNCMVVGKIKHYPFPEIELTNGTIYRARGANSPMYIRGKDAHLAICDEAAFFKDKVLSDTIEPMFSVTGKEKDSALIFISTPFGEGHFKDTYQQGQECTDGYYRSFHYDSLSNPFADMRRLNRIKERYGEDSLLWKTEYLGLFADSDLAVFSSDDIKRAIERFPLYDEHGKLQFPQNPQDGHRYAQGVDLANMRDYFVATVGDCTNRDLIYPVKMDRLQRKGYARYKAIIRENYTRYHGRTLIDATSLGESVVEDLRDIGAAGFKFSSASKYDLVHELVTTFAEGRFGLPNTRDIVDEFRYFEYKITPSKNLRMEAKRGHDDIVMSYALMNKLANEALMHGFFTPVDLTPAPVRQQGFYDPYAEAFSFDTEDDE
jgi:hypothetical protein